MTNTLERLLSATTSDDLPLLHDRTVAGVARLNIERLAEWIDEHYVTKLDMTPGDMIWTLPEDPVARDHARLEALLSENAETIAAFAKDAEAAVRIVAMMIGMDGAR